MNKIRAWIDTVYPLFLCALSVVFALGSYWAGEYWISTLEGWQLWMNGPITAMELVVFLVCVLSAVGWFGYFVTRLDD